MGAGGWVGPGRQRFLLIEIGKKRPVGYGEMEFGVHLAIPILGLCLIDNTYPERLAAACAEEGRYEFLYTATPLRLVGGTGCPVNPLAIF